MLEELKQWTMAAIVAVVMWGFAVLAFSLH